MKKAVGYLTPFMEEERVQSQSDEGSQVLGQFSERVLIRSYLVSFQTFNCTVYAYTHIRDCH